MKDEHLLALRKFASGLQMRQTLDETLKTLAYYTVQSTRAQGSVVSLVDPELGIQNVGTHEIPIEFADHARRLFLTLVDSPVHKAIRESLCVRVSVEQMPREFYGTPIPEYMKSRGWNKGLVAPLLRSESRVIGLIHAFFPIEVEPDDSEREFHETLASLAAVAVENALLVERLEKQVVVEERIRLGRELHDSVSQTLFSIGLGTQAALEALDSDPEDCRESLNYIGKLTRSALDEMRTLLFNLRPESFENEGLVDAIKQTTENLCERYGLNVSVALEEEPDLPPAEKHSLFRIATEALHNAVKHSRAESISVRLTNAEVVELAVEDDGVGMDLAVVPSGCFGLKTMTERAEEMGGTLEVDSSTGNGTRVVVRLSPVRGS